MKKEHKKDNRVRPREGRTGRTFDSGVKIEGKLFYDDSYCRGHLLDDALRIRISSRLDEAIWAHAHHRRMPCLPSQSVHFKAEEDILKIDRTRILQWHGTSVLVNG